MEGPVCEQRGYRFQGFDSVPVYNYKSLAGAIALAKLLRASVSAKKMMEAMKPDIVFSTGGYSSAPVMRAAKSLGVPLAIHACDTIPGRSLRMFANYAKVVTSTFMATEGVLGRVVIRTGHPVRSELRRAIDRRIPEENLIIVLGGSGGAKFLNEMVPQAARLLPDVRVLHSAGKAQFESATHLISGIENRYDLRPYFESDMMSQVYQTGALAIARSGSGISEFAMARMPSILVPLPTSADNHQFRNAQEFESMGAATVVNQETCTVEELASQINVWLKDKNKQETAARALSEWDMPDATFHIWSAVKNAAN